MIHTFKLTLLKLLDVTAKNVPSKPKSVLALANPPQTGVFDACAAEIKPHFGQRYSTHPGN